jgi:uncharacterized membrane protein YesL
MSELINKPYFKGLNNNQLKIIAMISMLIDHIGVAFFPSVKILRCIGRLAFPIYAYMIAEGCRYTKNRKKYLAMIAGMAFIFQIVYFVFMNSLYQGILVTFSLSIGTIFAIDSFIKNKNILNRILMAIIIVAIFYVSIILPTTLKDYGFKIDYGMWGLCLPIIVYFAPSKLWRIILSAIFLIFMSLSSNTTQWWSLLTIPLFMLYNGERGSKKLKYVFYLFYPIHLVIIYAIMFLLTIIKNFK